MSSRPPPVETAGPPARLGDWLAVIRPRLTAPLFHPAAVARLLAITPFLPGDGLGILETRLASGVGSIDLSIRLLKPDPRRCRIHRISQPHLRSFLTRWADPGGPFSSVRSVWLEFDLDRSPAGLPEPVPCAKLPAVADPLWVVDSLLPALRGRPLPRAMREHWLSCQREIPLPGRLLYAFSLLARGSDAVRMEIFGLRPGEILDLLQRIAPASLSQVSEIAPVFEGVERIHLSFDISADGVLPRIGIEGSYPRLPRREARWGALFSRLEERGLCEPGKREAALAWPGSDSFWTAPERWPAGAVGARGFCLRSLSHVKVVYRPDREPEAKVYLAFGHLERVRALPE
jgi:hypothetical protein